MTTKQLARLYDVLYNKAEKLFKEHNLCDMTENGCRSGKWGECCCYCDKCRHFSLTQSNCTVRMLGCKLRYCYIIEKVAEFAPVLKELDRMRRIMDRYGMRYSDTKEQLVRRLEKEA